MSRSSLLESGNAASEICPLRRTAPFDIDPGFYDPANLWLFGNVRLLTVALAPIPSLCGRNDHNPKELDEIERQTEVAVLDGKVLVCGIHNLAHQRSAVVPLRWGSPRIIVFSGGFKHHLGEGLNEEPFPVARLWRYEWDRKTDLAVSRRAPDKLPTFASRNPTVDRLISRIANRDLPGVLFDQPEPMSASRPFRIGRP